MVFNNEHEHEFQLLHIRSSHIFFCESSTCLRYKLNNSGLCNRVIFFGDVHHFRGNRPYTYLYTCMLSVIQLLHTSVSLS